jgi:hypothetical protein
LIENLRAAIELSQKHNRAELAINYPPMGLAGKDIRIRFSPDKPKKLLCSFHTLYSI